MALPQSKAEAADRTIIFVDETGFYMLPFVARTYAPRGQTPVLRDRLTRDHLSVISGVTLDGRLFAHAQEQAFRGAGIVAFLQRLLRHVLGKLLVIWDGATIDRCQEVKDYLAKSAATRLHLERLGTHRTSIRMRACGITSSAMNWPIDAARTCVTCAGKSG